MFKFLMIAAIIVSLGVSYEVICQDSSQRTQELAAALDKTKYKKKEKKKENVNISIEMYVDVKNQPIVKSNPAEYSGSYRGEDANYQLDIQVAPNGSATGSGRDLVDFDNGMARSFTLHDGQVHGALLTATKVYDNGQTEKFEAIFTNRTVSTGKNAETIENRDTTFGLGFIQSHGNDWTNRVFLERR